VATAGCGVTTSPEQVTPERYAERPTVAPQAAETFGTEAVDDAYDELVDFAFDVAFREEFLDPQREDYTAEELTVHVQPRLGPGALQTWSTQVAAALEGDTEAQDSLRILQFYLWEQPTWTVPAGGALQDQRITDAEISLAEAEADLPPRLEVRLAHAATMRYEEDGGPFRVEVRKSMIYELVLSEWATGPDWLVYAYDGRFQDRPLPR
jgi:hypothetical protein